MNGNSALLDTLLGAVGVVAVNNNSAVLNAAQLAFGTIVVTGTVTTGAAIVFPAGVSGWWTIYNITGGGGALLIEAVGLTEVIGAPSGNPIDVLVNTGVVKYRNLPWIGSYHDHAGSTVPNWITSCTIPPFLNCDGSAFSGSTYPTLAGILGSTTLPDFRGRGGFYLNAGTARLTSAGAGIDGNTIFAPGGANGVTLAANQIPSLTSTNPTQNIAVQSTNNIPTNGTINTVGTPGTGTPVTFISGPTGPAKQGSSGANSISVSYTNSGQVIIGNAAPGIVSGIRLIRAG